MTNPEIAVVLLTPKAYVTPRGAIYGGVTARRGETQLYAVEQAENTEAVRWITDVAVKPDSNRTVLIFLASKDVEVVQDGFWSDLESCWHDASGWPLRNVRVPAWAEKPKGPCLAAAGAAS